MTLVDELRRRARNTPEGAYLSFLSNGAIESISVGALWDLASRRAGVFRKARSRAASELIALVPTASVDTVVDLWAALAAGAGVMMLDPAWSPQQRRRIVERYDALDVSGPGDERVTDGGDASPSPAAVEIDPGDTALVFNTSGSTGIPKAVALSHAAIEANARSFVAHHSLDATARLMTCLPLHHSNAVNTCVIGALYSGGQSFVVPPTSLLDLPRLIRAWEPTIFSAVPSVFDALASLWRGEQPPASLRVAISAAAPLSTTSAASFLAATGVPILQAYGLTETVNFSTTFPADVSIDEYDEVVLSADIPSVGEPLLGVDLEIRDENGNLVPDGGIGEVYIGGEARMTEYLGEPEETRRVLIDGFVRTGDRGRIEQHPRLGRLVYLVGRSKNVAKVRGEQVSCEEVEHVLRSLAGVRDAGCMVVDDPRDGERLLAVIVGESADVDLDRILSDIANAWPRRMVPRQILRADEIPRTTTGKLRRAALREWVDGVERGG